MRQSRFTEEQFMGVLKEGEAGFSALGILGRGRTAPLRSLETPCPENRSGALPAEAVRCILPVRREMKTEIPAERPYRVSCGLVDLKSLAARQPEEQP